MGALLFQGGNIETPKKLRLLFEFPVIWLFSAVVILFCRELVCLCVNA